MQAPYRDSPANSITDLQDYYDVIPPAHRLSGFGHPHSPYDPTQDIPMTTTAAPYDFADTATRGGYAAVNTPLGGSNPSVVPKSSSRSKWIAIGSIATLVVLIVIGVSVGVSVSKKHHSSASSASSSNNPNNPNNPVNVTNPNDPSSFQPDPRLHKSFYGFAYTPEGSQLPECGNTLEQVITDIQLLSQLTSRLRLYGADCNQSALVLEAIKQTKVNMTVYLANYPAIGDNGTAYTRQKLEIQQAIQTYGTDQISGVIVGNEYMLDYLTDAGVQDANSAVANEGAIPLIGYINDTRAMLQSMGLSNIPVGNSDAGAYFNNMVLEAVDFGMANDHPWFANVSVDQAAVWTWAFFEQTDVAQAQALPNNPTMYIAETGWPSNSSDVSNESNGPSLATEGNLQTFLDTWVCQANANGTAYFYFEYFDELWKDPLFGGVEAHWGIFYSNRTLKGITIPNCPIS